PPSAVGINTGSIRRVDLLVYSAAHRRVCQAPGPDAAERENSFWLLHRRRHFHLRRSTSLSDRCRVKSYLYRKH
ncbi:unnamed protein product, partial [Ixodes persulcatus]